MAIIPVFQRTRTEILMKASWIICLVPLLAASALSQNRTNEDVQKCHDLSGDPAIEACTRAIASGQLSQGALANSYYNRGCEWRAKSEYDRAIADFDQVLQLDPNFVSAYNNRGVAWRGKGEYDRAIADYDQAIRLDPNHANAYYNRGVAHFGRGEWSAAAPDFARFHELNTRNAYAVLWQALTGMRQPEPGWAQRLEEQSQGLGQGWPMPVLRFYAGQLTADQVLAAAVDPDPVKQQDHLCGAAFYLGEWKLVHGQAREATEDLKKAQSTCPRNYQEYSAAVQELKNLGSQ